MGRQVREVSVTREEARLNREQLKIMKTRVRLDYVTILNRILKLNFKF